MISEKRILGVDHLHKHIGILLERAYSREKMNSTEKYEDKLGQMLLQASMSKHNMYNRINLKHDMRKGSLEKQWKSSIEIRVYKHKFF